MHVAARHEGECVFSQSRWLWGRSSCRSIEEVHLPLQIDSKHSQVSSSDTYSCSWFHGAHWHSSKPLDFIWEVPSSNVDLDTGYLYRGSRNFPQYLHTDAELVPSSGHGRFLTDPLHLPTTRRCVIWYTDRFMIVFTWSFCWILLLDLYPVHESKTYFWGSILIVF